VQRALLFLLVLCLTVPALALAESDSEKKKKKEEALRQEAKAVTENAQVQSTSVSLHGKFSVAKELAGDDKPLPKVVGYLATDGVLYPVMVAQPAALGTLLSCDNKDISVTGKVLDKGDDGKFLVVITVIFPSGTPQAKRKRGGL